MLMREPHAHETFCYGNENERYDSSFIGDHGDLIHINDAQIFALKEYFSPTALACKYLQKFANLNSLATDSA